MTQGKQGTDATVETADVNVIKVSMLPQELHEQMERTERRPAQDVAIMACAFHSSLGFEMDNPIFDWFQTQQITSTTDNTIVHKHRAMF